MSYYSQQNAKALVEKQMFRKHGFGFGAVPSINLIGIGYGKIIVQVEDETHPGNYYIPTELDELTGFGGLPIDIEYGGLYRLQGRQGGGGGGGCQGGARVSSTEQGTCMLVGKGVTDPNNKYAVVSHHVTSGCKQSATIGGTRLNVHKSSGCGKTFWEGCAMGPANNCSENVLGLGVPKGIEKPAIGMVCNMQAQTTGKMNGKVTAINFNAPRSTSLGTGACSISIQDMFQSKPCPTHGDSGGAFWNDRGNILGIVTYGSTNQGGKNDTRCSAYNPSAIHMPEVIGVTVGSGVVGGPPPLTPGGPGSPDPAHQQQQRQAPSNLQVEAANKRRGSGWDLSDLELDWNIPQLHWNPEILHPENAIYQGYASNDCSIMRGIWWWQGKIADTGTPNGGPAYRGAPASFVNMIQLYNTKNILVDKGHVYFIPASNERATGPAQEINACMNGPIAKPAAGNSGGNTGNPGGLSTAGDRFCMGQMQSKSGNWVKWKFMIDSGASFVMCSDANMRSLGLKGGSQQQNVQNIQKGQKYSDMVKFQITPFKAVADMPVGFRDYNCRDCTPTPPGSPGLSDIAKIVITKGHTILIAQDGSGAISYGSRGTNYQQGDALNGAWQQTGSNRGYRQEYEAYYGITLA